MNQAVQNTFQSLELLIGNTPMVGIQYRYKNKQGIIYVKCESYNFTGSIKDRMALYILKKAYESGELKPGDTIVEATSGNSGISFSAIGRMLGHPVSILMPDWMSLERKLLIKSFGAEIILVSKEQGGFLGSIAKSKEMAAQNPHVFLPCQFSNLNNVTAHEVTGEEILTQLKTKGLRPNAFVAGVGTGGTVVGVGKALKTAYSDIKVHPLEPEESPTLSTGHKVGCHRIQGISDEFIPDIMKSATLNEVVQASDGDSIIMAQKLATTLGFGVGISSGANLIGAIKLQQQYGQDCVVVTVFPDCNKKYLTTNLTRPEEVKEHYLAPQVELLGFQTSILQPF